MTTDDIILQMFCLVDDSLPDIPRHSQAKLYPSELVTIGILFSLKGGYFRAFYRWLKRDYGDWFGDGTLPERTRLERLLKTHQEWCSLLLADPTFFTVIDSYPIELIFPIREGRSDQQVGKKGRDKGRWSIGIKFLLAAQRILSRRRLGLGHYECLRQAFSPNRRTIHWQNYRPGRLRLP